MLGNYLAVDKMEKRFRELGVASLILIFLVILAGGVVRTTGSGMGCPEWPKCFGEWVPPTDVSQLPVDYQTRFNVHGHGVAEFNVFKTWTEYSNRLLGAVLGLVIFIQFLFSFVYYHKDKKIFIATFITLCLVGFNGWLGSVVVASNLAPFKVTLHMLLAVAAVYTLTYSVRWRFIPAFSYYNKQKFKSIFISLLVFWFLTILQIILGTRVREGIDVVARELGDGQRAFWIETLGGVFKVHRSLSILLFAFSSYLFFYIRSAYKQGEISKSLYKLTLVTTTTVLVEIVLGVVMAYFSVPRWSQPLHLLMGALLTNFQFLQLLTLYKQQTSVRINVQSAPVAYSSYS